MRGGLVRLTIGFASRVAAGKERGSAARLSDRRQRENRRCLPRAISSAIREDFGTKTEVSHDEGFISARHRGLLFGRRKNPQVKASLNSRATDGPRLPRGVPRFSCQDLPWGLYYFRLARHSDSEEQLALPSVRFACLLPEATPYGYRAAILRMPCNLDASSSIPISSSAW